MKTRLVNSKTRIVLGVFFMIIFGVLAGGAWSLFSRASVEIPKISVEKQNGTPLLISAAHVTSTDAFKPSYQYTVTNVSSKPIRAYTIRYDTTFGQEKSKSTGSSLSHLIAISMLFEPNQSRVEVEGSSTRYTAAVSEIVLSVDFVEFADNTSWGEDRFKSAENLAGQRAGGSVAIKYFSEKLKLNGLDALIAEIENEELTLPSVSNNSSRWQDGFKTGVAVIRRRLNDANHKGGLDVIKQELEKPYDASEGRKER